jgi:hypothetical protein
LIHSQAVFDASFDADFTRVIQSATPRCARYVRESQPADDYRNASYYQSFTRAPKAPSDPRAPVSRLGD